MTRRICSLLLLLLILSLFPTSSTNASQAFQEKIESRLVTFAELGYPRDEMYKGVLVSRDYSVRWPDAWQVQPGNILKLVFSHSPVLHPKSSMIVDWNGSRLVAVLLVKENTDRAELEIAVPEDLIVTGYNRLHIEFYMGLDEDFCKDEDNPALWATVHSNSALSFAYSLQAPELDLGLYPLPLIDNSPLVENDVTFILPVDPTASELNAAAAASAGLGRLADWHAVNINVQDAAAPLPAGDLVIIGRPDRMPLLSSSSLPYLKKGGSGPVLQDSAGNPLPDGTGLLWEEISSVDPNAAALFVTGESDEAVLKAARALASTATINRLTGQVGLVLSVPEPLQPGPGSRQSFTLQDLGYPDMQARGTREQNITYVIPLERSWQNESEVLLDLHFAHSNLLNSRRSSITIEVNGTASGSVALTLDNASDAHTTFHLPARLFKVGTNTLTVTANLRLPDDVERDWDCLNNHSLDSWITVYADSLVTLPADTSAGFVTLEDFPSAFIGTNSLADVVFVVPEKFSIQSASAVTRLAYGLAGASEGDNFFPGVILAVDMDAAVNQYHYLYIIGRPSQNTAVQAFSDSLPMPYLPGTEEPTEVSGIARLVTGSSSVGYIQVFPGNQGYPYVLVSGNTDEGVLWAADTLQNPSTNSRLSGDVVILDGPASITATTLRYKSAAGVTAGEPVPVSLPSVSVAGTAIQPTLWMIYAAVGVFLLAVLILIIFALVEIQRRHKERSRYGSHSA